MERQGFEASPWLLKQGAPGRKVCARALKVREPLKFRFEKMVYQAQDKVCAAVERVDGRSFGKDWWKKEAGAGLSRVLQDGNVWEKAGVNVSAVQGEMDLEAYQAATGCTSLDHSKMIPFMATGISSVMHPRNPFAPTLHFNFRFSEAEGTWWFGGGVDLTPSYIIEEDIVHFHKTLKTTCDRFDLGFYPRFKRRCDEYFVIKHRGERRGVGGIFFDRLNDRDPEEVFAFASESASSVLEAYIPIIVKRKDSPFTQANKNWQQLRRGRYVEFNLVNDKGTEFGFRTGGRVESILMSLPLTARWEYDHEPAQGSEEWELLDVCRNPREWV